MGSVRSAGNNVPPESRDDDRVSPIACAYESPARNDRARILFAAIRAEAATKSPRSIIILQLAQLGTDELDYPAEPRR